MAEAVAAVASVIAIVQLADRVIGVCKFYIESIKDVPSDLRTILLETSALKSILENLQFITTHDDPHSAIAKNISGPDGPIEGCRRTIRELEKLFPQNASRTTRQDRSNKRRLDLMLTALAWPLKETKARKLLDELIRHKATISLALTTSTAQDVREINKKTSEIHEILTENKVREVYDWLQQSDPSSLHQRAQKNYEPETGNWIWKVPSWTNWLAGKHRAIHIHGIPGSGKTVLMSYLIEQTEKHCHQDSPRTRIQVYYYCHFAHNQDESKPFLKWLISRLCREAGGIPTHVADLSRHGTDTSLGALFETIARLILPFQTVYIALDAIDESQNRKEILQVLKTLATDLRFKKLKIITSGREYRDIEQVMLEISEQISMSHDLVQRDISRVVKTLIQSNLHFQKWPPDLLQEVEESIAVGANGMFRWAVCQVDAIRRLKPDRIIVQKALKTLPITLYETYDRILAAVPEEDRMFMYHVLWWIAFADGLSDVPGFRCKALLEAAEASLLQLTGKQNDRLYDKDILADIGGCLINIHVKPFSIDGGSLVVHFAHYTVQEYLDSNLQPSGSPADCTFGRVDRDQRLLEVALTRTLQMEDNELTQLRSVVEHRYSGLESGICEKFTFYGTVLVMSSVSRSSVRIRHNTALEELIIDFCAPSKTHYPTLRKLLGFIFDSHLRRNDNWMFLVLLQDLQWHHDANGRSEHLYNLLQLAEYQDGILSLVENYFGKENLKKLMQARVSTCGKLNIYSCWPIDIEGPFIEICAQLPLMLPDAFGFLLRIGAGLFDPSIVLLLYLAAHWRGNSGEDRSVLKKSDVVEQLLELGANPNIEVYRVTLLQIACMYYESKVVELLLKAGARPNDTGNETGLLLRENMDMVVHEAFHGRSPLNLCRTRLFLPISIHRIQRTEELLIQYGAEDIRLKG